MGRLITVISPYGGFYSAGDIACALALYMSVLNKTENVIVGLDEQILNKFGLFSKEKKEFPTLFGMNALMLQLKKNGIKKDDADKNMYMSKVRECKVIESPYFFVGGGCTAEDDNVMGKIICENILPMFENVFVSISNYNFSEYRQIVEKSNLIIALIPPKVSCWHEYANKIKSRRELLCINGYLDESKYRNKFYYHKFSGAFSIPVSVPYMDAINDGCVDSFIHRKKDEGEKNEGDIFFDALRSILEELQK